MRYFLFTILFCLGFSALAQRPPGSYGGGKKSGTAKVIGNSKLVGLIVDSVNNQPVEFAAVGLWKDGKAIDGTLTNDKGAYKFEGMLQGTYKLLISFVGYQAKSVEGIVVKNNNTTVSLDPINLAGDNISLDEVVVTGQAALVEDKVDRIVYNADKDDSNKGGAADEVLRKVPLLSVDIDGNVEMRGSSNVRVLINNKPSTIFASSVGEALQQIPAEQIKSVEVITSPGAKYDGEGTAGIVNIILKKNTFAGVTGNLSTGVGYQGSSLNGTINLRDKKWGLSINGGARYSYNFFIDTENNRESVVNGVTNILDQTGSNKSVYGGGRVRATFDYDFDKFTNFSISWSGRNRLSGGEGDLFTNLVNGSGEVLFDNSRFIDQSSRRNSNDIDLSFIKKYENPLQELSMLGQYSYSKRQSDFTAVENGFPQDSSLNDGVDREITLQLDYVHPIGEKSKWESGLKGILRKATSDGDFFSYSQESLAYFLNDRRSNFLDYDQDVVSAYTSFTLNLPKKWGLQAGMRYEQTLIRAEFKEVPDADIPDYSNFLPSINLSKRFEKGGSFRLSYTQRIQRPSIRFLNPFVDFSNQNDISFGEPTLDPELVDQIEANVSTYFKRNSLNFSIYHRFTDNSIERIRNIRREDGIDITETTYGNIGQNRRIGTNFSFNLMPNKDFRIGGGLNASYVYMDNSVISNQGMNYNFNLNSSYQLPKDWSVSLFTFASLPSVELQGTRGGFYFHTIGTRKKINDGRGSFGLTLENPLFKSINLVNELEDLSNPDNYFIQTSVRRIRRRAVRVDFQYRFGKMDSQRESLFRKRKSVKNDDQLSGDDGGMM